MPPSRRNAIPRRCSGISSMDEFQFLRESLVKADTAQLDKKGNVVKGPRTNRRYKKGMVQTYTVTWKDAESLVQTTLPITQYNLGRKVLLYFLVLPRELLLSVTFSGIADVLWCPKGG